MKLQKDNALRFATLSAYPFTERLTIRLAGLLFYWAIRVIGYLTSFEIVGGENLESVIKSERLPIFAYWHDRMFLTIYFLRNRGSMFLTSRSFDGEYLARIFQRFGYGIIRGSSSQGGSEALAKLTEAMTSGHSASMTVDGPRGPRYEAKIGAIILAKRTGNPVLPIVIESKSYWNFNSWDKLQVPRPFKSALAMFGEPIYVDAGADSAEIEAKHRQLQDSLDSLVESGRQWRESS